MSELTLAEIAVVMVWALVGVPAAGLLHEFCHVLFVWPVATEVEFDWREQYVIADVPRTRFAQRWADAAGLAPAIVGVLAAIYLLEVGSPLQSPASPLGLVQWVIWGVFSIGGGLSDYIPSLSRSRATPEQSAD